MNEHETGVLNACWELVTKGQNRETALQYAIIGESFLQSRVGELISGSGEIGELLRLASGFNIVSVAYLWNNKIEDAKRCDAHYLFNSILWDHLATVIAPYLEMLMAKKQTNYLDKIFSHEGFQRHFLGHYEVYISLFVNGRHECTQVREMITIVNRVNNKYKAYI